MYKIRAYFVRRSAFYLPSLVCVNRTSEGLIMFHIRVFRLMSHKQRVQKVN